MSQIPIPKIDPRRSKEIYEQALALAEKYCPEWTPADNGEDMGIALLKLFSRLAETAIEQLNRVPEKHQLAFYDFIGMDHLPPTPAKVSLTFSLTEGSKQALVPARTKVASAQDPTIIFETLESLTSVLFPLDSLYSLNPWTDTYTDHQLDEEHKRGIVLKPETVELSNGDYIFGGDGTEKSMEHAFHLADELLNFSFPIDFDVKLDLQSYEPGTIDFSPGVLLSDFSESEFRTQDKSLAPLCQTIKNEGYDLSVLTVPENTILWLNEVLRIPGLFEKIIAKKTQLILTNEIKKLKELTENSRKKIFKDLSISELNLLIRLNRLMIETAYPDKSPALPSGTLQVNYSQQVIPKQTLNGLEANWLAFKSGIPLQKNNLPEINSITLDVTAQGAPDIVLFNNVPVDVKKGFYPFGETPKKGDTLYIGGGELFSKEGTSIALNLNLRGGEATKDSEGKELSLIWEYWDGTQWSKSLPDGTDWKITLLPTGLPFTADGKNEVSFTCPPIETTELNGIANKWIRVRIDSGAYGETAHYNIQSNDEIVNTLANQDEAIKPHSQRIIELLKTNGISLGMKYDKANFEPPFINSIFITCSSQSKPIQQYVTYNNYEYKTIKTISSSTPLIPFELSHEDSPAFYLGFEEYPVNNPVSLYFSLKGWSSQETPPRIHVPDYTGEFDFTDKVQGLVWEYYSTGHTWESIGPEDGTDLLTRSGIVTFIPPSDLQKASLFNKDRNWLRLRFKEGSWFDSPRLKGIYVNTVWAENAKVINNELLGSSNGEPGQTFTCSSNPILKEQIIEIKEPSVPSEEELSVIGAEGEADPLRLIKNASGDIQEVWVQWKEVSSFLDSKPISRHYVVDRIEGRIIFGDGVHGMIPPPLPNNILAREYKSGGGIKGNCKAGNLTELKAAIPNIQGASNTDAASGGADLEIIEKILERTPYTIKNRGRAMTQEDFEWLAKEASQEVAKSRCVKEADETIRVIIAPLYHDGSLYPETSLKEQVGGYLKERAYAFIREKILVTDPDYVDIDVATTVVPISLSEGAVVVERVERRLREYLEPITGGNDQKGWEFGASIFRSKIAALIEDVEGVDYVKNLMISKSGGTGPNAAPFLLIGEDQLPKAGRIIVIPNRGER